MMAKKPKFQAPNGMHDILPQDQVFFQKVYGTAQNMANFCGFQRIDTPLIEIPVSAKSAGATGRVIVKDESRLPTASFKARGLALGVSMAKSLGLTKLAMPTAGNAGAAMSAYARRGGMQAYVFCPEDAPEVNVQETCLQGGFEIFLQVLFGLYQIGRQAGQYPLHKIINFIFGRHCFINRVGN